jgi:DnaJ-class molecular chaperone
VIGEDWSPYPMGRVIRPDPDCEACAGYGSHFIDRADARGEHFTTEQTCDACGGTGKEHL